jgi:tRNA threonylcarbamoyladenosine biosynthesis protein TsaE
MKNWYKIFTPKGLTTSSPDEMRSLGEAIGREISAGEIIGIIGDLGAGKTHLTQGIVRGLGSHAQVVSPTFALVHEYNDGRLPVDHFDFYRMTNEAELEGIGWDDYLDRSQDILIVEWADLFPHALPEDSSWIRIEHKGPQERLVTLLA